MQSPLLLSCKLTNAVLKFLERRGEDLEPLYERFDWPLYYLRDSSSWLEADRLEYVLKTLNELYGNQVANETGVDFFSVVGHASPSLRAWGALDSVLKIVPGVRELYQQPDRFLASFISPQPQIQGLQHSDENVVFRIGFSDDRMPHTARFLRAILESLPEFIGKPRSHVMWNHGHVSIEWSVERQVPFASSHGSLNDNLGPSLSPDLLRTILVDLATAQRDLENARRMNQEKDSMIQSLQAAAAAEATRRQSLAAVQTVQTTQTLQTTQTVQTVQTVQAVPVATVDAASVERALHEIYKLGDYFARAQQIVTLLRAPRANSALQTDALIKRTAWDRVAEEAPAVIRKASLLLQGQDVPPDEHRTLVDVTDSVAQTKTETKNKSKMIPSAARSRTPSFFDSPSMEI